MRKLIVLIFLLILILLGIWFLYKSGTKNKFIIITDLEPDDRIALHVIAARIPEDQILFFGSMIKNANRKQELVRKLLDQIGFSEVPLYQGTGGPADSYYDIVSSRAAREYSQEGEYLLPVTELELLQHASYSSPDLQNHIEAALEKYNDVQFILLAPPTDLVAVLKKNPRLKKNIKHIHIMGGWTEVQENGETVLRTTYNWNMDPVASAKLVLMKDIPMTLYSSHTIKKWFDGGSCNIDNCKNVIERMEQLRPEMPSLNDQIIAATSWDEHVIAKIPALKPVIEPYKGKQFTPADPLVAVGIVNPAFILTREAVDIRMDIDDFNKDKGFRVYVTPDPASKIDLVQAIDVEIFKSELIKSFDILAKKA